MSIKEHDFEIDGHKLKFNVISGTVLDTEQRSDTHVSGGGSAISYKGIGAGQSKVTSTVEVNRDVWIKDDDGKEHHLRFNFDFPLRIDQKISKISLSGSNIRTNLRVKEIEMSVLNNNTGEWHWIKGNYYIAKPKSKFSFWRVFIKWLKYIFLALFVVKLFYRISIYGISIHSYQLADDFKESMLIAASISIPVALFIWYFFGTSNKEFDKKIREEHSNLITKLANAN